MIFNEKLLDTLELDVPAMEADQEGKLLGGFSSLAVSGYSLLKSNGACHGCTVNTGDCKEECGHNEVCHGCTVNSKTCPPPTTTTTTGVNLGYASNLGLSLLF